VLKQDENQLKSNGNKFPIQTTIEFIASSCLVFGNYHTLPKKFLVILNYTEIGNGLIY